MTLQFATTTLALLGTWRASYLDSLSYAQDMYSESMITWDTNVACYTIMEGSASVGYVILNASNELVEFYIHDGILQHKEEVFTQVIHHFGVTSVYCKSFDQVLLSCCHQFCASSSMVGYLFQDYIRPLPTVVLEDALEVRLATQDDVALLNSFDNELLEDGERIESYVENKSVYMFTKDDALIGCGYLFAVIPGRAHYDVGMWVNQSFRRHGYATQIISYLIHYCLDHGWIPTAGCALDNTASRRTLEKCGFRSRLCLINFKDIEN